MIQRRNSKVFKMTPQGNDEENLAIALTASNLSPGDSSRYPMNNSRHPCTQWTASQLRELLFSFFLFFTGLYLPKLLLFPTAEETQDRTIPFTILESSGEVILEPRYNHSVAYPPMVGSSFLIFTAVYMPFTIVVLVELFRRQSPHTILCTLCMAIGLSEFVTRCLKFWVLRPRPNFYHLCGFDMVTKQCLVSYPHVVEAQVSFPSGHTSLSFCSMTVLALWMFQIIRWKQRTCGASTTRLFLFLSILIPWGWATFVGVSRIVDNWHHPSDVVAGCLIGIACGGLSFVIYSSTSQDFTESSSATTTSTMASSRTLRPSPSSTISILSKESLE